MKYWFRECPKCHGDLREELDTFGEHITCMQCGYTLTQTEELQLELHGTLRFASLEEPARK
jgi:predicted nucleic-acid-binding Zn-ribbon protein